LVPPIPICSVLGPDPILLIKYVALLQVPLDGIHHPIVIFWMQVLLEHFQGRRPIPKRGFDVPPPPQGVAIQIPFIN
jgi:hypothetical protein